MTNKPWWEESYEKLIFHNLHLIDNLIVAAEIVGAKQSKMKDLISKVEREAYEKGVKEALEKLDTTRTLESPLTKDEHKKLDSNQMYVSGQLGMLLRLKIAISELLKKPNTPQS